MLLCNTIYAREYNTAYWQPVSVAVSKACELYTITDIGVIIHVFKENENSFLFSCVTAHVIFETAIIFPDFFLHSLMIIHVHLYMCVTLH